VGSIPNDAEGLSDATAFEYTQLAASASSVPETTMRIIHVSAVLLAIGLPFGMVDLATAQECRQHAVKAKGGVGRLEATAKSRARSTWIKKVRADRRLGPAYAAWLRAKKPTYSCRKLGRKRVVCEASAIPCKI
jgi:hypothetical protein